MNILSLIHVHRLPNPSGVGRVMDQLISTHAELNPSARHRMLVQEKLHRELKSKLEPFWQEMPAETYKGSTSFQQALWILAGLPSAERYWKGADVVYCPAESYIPTKKAKLVCTIHDVAGFEDTLYPPTRSQLNHRRKWRMMFDKMADHADTVVTVSNFSATRIAALFPKLEKKLKVVYNAPHSIFGTPVEKDDGDAVGRLVGNAPFILVPGGLSLRKNAKLILAAWPLIADQCSDVKLVICGSSASQYMDELKADGDERVVNAGFVEDGFLNALYQLATLVWFPSRYEGFGMPAVEAMVCSTPVVASSVASIPEIVGDCAMLGSPDDPGWHADAVGSLISSSELRRELSETGREWCRRFSWENSARKLEEVFVSA